MSIYDNFQFNKEIKKCKSTFTHKSGAISKDTIYYALDFVSLDTETSHNHDNDSPIGWIYQWAFKFQEQIIYGRTPTQLCINLKLLSNYLQLGNNKRLLCFVHNLPYDFSYLVQFFNKYFGEPTSVLAYATHKVFTIVYSNGLEFRCSYKLSNKSLDKWSKDLNTKHKKLVETIDYDKINLQNSKLSSKDWKYQFYDVIVLDECIKEQLKQYNDNTASIPYTSTGYVRREIKRTFKKDYTKNRAFFQKLKLNERTYKAYRYQFSGGITHGDRALANKTIVTYKSKAELKYLKKIYGNSADVTYIKGKIKHYDFISHYPTQQITKLFPSNLTQFLAENYPAEKLSELSKKYGLLLRVTIGNYGIRDKTYPIPYIQYSHCCQNYYKGSHYIVDNGRVLSNDGYSTLYLLYDELKLIVNQYDIEYLNIDEVYSCELAPLPEYLTSVINKAFKNKSDYKIKEKQAEKEGLDEKIIFDYHTDLLKSKNLLNGIYGCTATDIIREQYSLNNNIWYKSKPSTEEEIKNILNKYYNRKTSCLAYEWGAYTTTYARLQLMECVDLIYNHYKKIREDNQLNNSLVGCVVYADTDSAFFIDDLYDTIEKELNEYNKKLKEINLKNGYYIKNTNGEIIQYNQFENEKEDIEAFRFLHAKCYVYKERNKSMREMKCTIAGVSGLNSEKARELQHINNLKNGFVFKKCGGKKAKYISHETIEYKNGLEYADACIITPTEKTMSNMDIDDDYYIIKILNNGEI